MAHLIRWVPRSTVADRNPMTNDLWRNNWNNVLRPAMDVIENENDVTVRVNLPGLNPDDIDIQVEDDLLTISGEIKTSEEQENERYHYRERSYGAFKRSLRLADTIDAQNIDATYENGVLALALPKRPETQPKRIKVETA
jgi:HSP20 family protein